MINNTFQTKDKVESFFFLGDIIDFFKITCRDFDFV